MRVVIFVQKIFLFLISISVFVRASTTTSATVVASRITTTPRYVDYNATHYIDTQCDNDDYDDYDDYDTYDTTTMTAATNRATLTIIEYTLAYRTTATTTTLARRTTSTTSTRRSSTTSPVRMTIYSRTYTTTSTSRSTLTTRTTSSTSTRRTTSTSTRTTSTRMNIGITSTTSRTSLVTTLSSLSTTSTSTRRSTTMIMTSTITTTTKSSTTRMTTTGSTIRPTTRSTSTQSTRLTTTTRMTTSRGTTTSSTSTTRSTSTQSTRLTTITRMTTSRDTTTSSTSTTRSTSTRTNTRLTTSSTRITTSTSRSTLATTRRITTSASRSTSPTTKRITTSTRATTTNTASRRRTTTRMTTRTTTRRTTTTTKTTRSTTTRKLTTTTTKRTTTTTRRATTTTRRTTTDSSTTSTLVPTTTEIITTSTVLITTTEIVPTTAIEPINPLTTGIITTTTDDWTTSTVVITTTEIIPTTTIELTTSLTTELITTNIDDWTTTTTATVEPTTSLTTVPTTIDDTTTTEVIPTTTIELTSSDTSTTTTGILCHTGSLVQNDDDELTKTCFCLNGYFGLYCSDYLVCDDVAKSLKCNFIRSDGLYSDIYYEECSCKTAERVEDTTKSCKSILCSRLSTSTNEMTNDTAGAVLLMANAILNSRLIENTPNIDDSLIYYYVATIVNKLHFLEIRDQSVLLSNTDLLLSLLDTFLQQDEAYIYASQIAFNTSQILTAGLEKYFKNLDLGNMIYAKTLDNIAALSLGTLDNSFYGFKIELDSNDFNFVNRSVAANTSKEESNKFKTLVYLNPNIVDDYKNESIRLSFVVYEKPKLFLERNLIKANDSLCTRQITSDIVSAVTSVDVSGENLISLYLQDTVATNSQCGAKSVKTYSCVFWNYETSSWDPRGCVYTFIDNKTHRCVCSHLTSFAILLEYSDKPITCEICKAVLEYVSYIGVSLSILGLTITIVFQIYHYRSRIENNKVSQNSMFKDYYRTFVTFCCSLLALNVFYLIFSFLKSDRNLVPCVLFGVLLHYSLLTSFLWMLSLGILQYLIYNKVFVTVEYYYYKSVGVVFVLPLLPIVIILAVNWRLYINSYNYCWLTGVSHILTVLVPICVIVIVNLVLFIQIAREHCSCCFNNDETRPTRNLSRDSVQRYRQRMFTMLTTCFCNMGLTWLFAFLALLPADDYTRTVFTFIFCIFNAFQGFLLFLAYLVLSKIKYIKQPSSMFGNKKPKKTVNDASLVLPNNAYRRKNLKVYHAFDDRSTASSTVISQKTKDSSIITADDELGQVSSVFFDSKVSLFKNVPTAVN